MTTPTIDDFLRTIRVLDARIWHQDLTQAQIDEWVSGFDGTVEERASEQHLALALLSRFTLFGIDEMRVLLRYLYEDILKHRIACAYRRAHDDSTDLKKINRHVDAQVRKTAFVGAGNPAESGAHILYYFRQVSNLPITNFWAVEALLNATKSELGAVNRVVLLDDLCGSGKSAVRFGKSFVAPLQDRRADYGLPPVETIYLTVCGTDGGMENARECGHYSSAETALLLDDSHRVFSETSRYLTHAPDASPITLLSLERSRKVVELYGSRLLRRHPLGFDQAQLILGFAHNIPNNTLPVFWCSGSTIEWRPVFSRFAKRYR